MDLGRIDQEKLFRVLLDNLYDGVYFTNRQRRIQYWNKGAERITGYTTDEVVGHCCADNILMHVDSEGRNLCQEECPLAATISDGQERRANVYLHHKEGHRVPILVAVSAIYDDSGELVGALETFHDISTEMAALQEVALLRKQSLLCPLTGIGNRRYTEEMLGKRLSEMMRTESSLAVMFFDVDHFKAVNDTYGHRVGDVVLKMVARSLAGAMRPYDFLGRWGGEEFVALAPNLKQHQLDEFANRLRVLVARSSRQVSQANLTVTVSVGATLAKRGESRDQVVARADQLMYASKKHGRNRVTTG